MNRILFRFSSLLAFGVLGIFFLSSCSVDQSASLSATAAAEAARKKTPSGESEAVSASWSERVRSAREERENERAARQNEEEAEARKLAAEKKKEEAREKILAERAAKEEAAREAAETKAREASIAEREKAKEERRAARLAAREKAQEEREARRLARREREGAGTEVAAVAERSGGGFFSRFAISSPNQFRSPGHSVQVNQALLPSLNPSNAKIEISISEQRARVYRTGAGGQQLVIETQISTGKPGHSTPTGSFRIQEKLVHKQSSLYGSWHNASGAVVVNGDSRRRPSGGVRFVGAEMPYWMRINGGIGIHVGYVPDGPASHGCIRVPEAVQPLIFSKVGVGTPVTVRY